MNNIFDQGQARRTALQNQIGGQVAGRIAGNNPLLAQGFRAQDEATATGINQARMNSMQPGMFGQGRASRGAQMTQQSALQQMSANKGQQSAMAAKDVQDATTQGMGYQNNLTAEDQNNRDFAYKASSDLGDSVGMAGMGANARQQTGLTHTAYGETAQQNQATQQAADAAQERARADAEWQYTQQQRAKAAKGPGGMISGLLNGAGSIAGIIPGGQAVGLGLKGAGAITSLFGK